MEFVPICLYCENFHEKDKCEYFKPIPHEIKNREIKCKYYTGENNYPLYSADSKPQKE